MSLTDVELNMSQIPMDNQGVTWRFWRRRRLIVAFLVFLGFFNVYALRVNLSVAIVAMNSDVKENGTVIQPREFDWSPEMQGWVLSSFFYGYIVTQIPGGWLAARIGGNRVFGIGIAATAFLTLVTPPLARAHVYALIAVRIIEGLFEGVTYPCIHAVWARWAPPLERSRLASIGFSGSYFGTVVSMPVCSILAENFGWESIFYVFGAVGIIWYICWTWIVASSPEQDENISTEELKYIQDALGQNGTSQMKISHPWKKYLTSLPVWAIVFAHFSENWGFYTLLTQLPTFLKDILQFNLKDTGFIAALPYLFMAVILQFAGHFADWLISKNIMTVTQVRKAFNCSAFISQAVFMMIIALLLQVIGYVGAIICLTTAVGLGAFAWAGFSVNHLDIAPQHASVLMGLSNTVATLPGMISPAITGYIVTKKTEMEWQIVFFIASAIYLAGAIFYGIFASGERQKWAKEDSGLEEKSDDFSRSNPALEMN